MDFNLAVELFTNVFANRQSNTIIELDCSLLIVLLRDNGLEDVLKFFFCHSHTLIFDCNFNEIIGSLRLQCCEYSDSPLSLVFGGIGKKIEQDLLQPPFIKLKFVLFSVDVFNV